MNGGTATHTPRARIDGGEYLTMLAMLERYPAASTPEQLAPYLEAYGKMTPQQFETHRLNVILRLAPPCDAAINQ